MQKLNSVSLDPICEKCGQPYFYKNNPSCTAHFVHFPLKIETSLKPQNDYYEKQYQKNEDPWNYDQRGNELYRLNWVVKKIKPYLLAESKILELGCGNGALSKKIEKLVNPFHVFSIDISASAIARASQKKSLINWGVGSVLDIAFPKEYFDFVLVMDGLLEWQLGDQDTKVFLESLLDTLKPGGYVLFSDYSHPNLFSKEIAFIEDSPFEILKIEYLYDRMWYRLEQALKPFKKFKIISQFLKSERVALACSKLFKWQGARASKHIAILAQKK